MSAAGRSLFVFGIYMMILGILMVVVPNVLLGVLGLPSTSEVWIRVAGMLVIIIGFYDLQAGRKGLNDFLLWSIIARTSVILFFAAFVLLGFVKPILIVFGAIDLIGAAWTLIALQTAVSHHSDDIGSSLSQPQMPAARVVSLRLSGRLSDPLKGIPFGRIGK